MLILLVFVLFAVIAAVRYFRKSRIDLDEFMKTAAAGLSHNEESKSWLILVSPFSGSRKGPDVLVKELAPLFESVGEKYRCVETKYNNHAFEIARMTNLDLTIGIIVISGDGMVSEVINGIHMRDDAEKLFERLIIAHIPAGTGNGIAKSLGFSNCKEAVNGILKGHTRKVDTFLVTGKKFEMRSVLMCTWGAVADYDLWSEIKIRWMTNLRTILAPIIVILSGKTYGGTVHFVNSKTDEWVSLSGEFCVALATNFPWIAHDCFACPPSRLQDGCIDIVFLMRSSRWRVLNFFLKSGSGAHLDEIYVKHFKTRTIRFEPKGGFYSIDGNVRPAEEIQIKVLPASVNMIACEKKSCP